MVSISQQRATTMTVPCIDHGQPAAEPNPWKEAVLEQLVAHSMDAPLDEPPALILKRIIHMAVQMATDPAINGQPKPVLTVEKEPDYWTGGHFYQGKKPWIDPFKVYALPIGTNLYTAP